MRYTDERIETEARKMGLTAEVKAGGDVFVKTPFGGHWRIIYNGFKWKIHHENYRCVIPNRKSICHKHNRMFPDPVSALKYIKVHDAAVPFLHKTA